MGISYDGSIKNYWPDDTETIMYIYGNYSLSEIIEKIKDHFGNDVNLDDVSIRSEYIHTSCLTYDLYVPSDYTNFIVVEKY
jgi:hypothetical protein